MSLTELIKDIKERGFISVAPLRFEGKAKPVFEMLAIMANTEPEKIEPNWWAERMYLGRN